LAGFQVIIDGRFWVITEALAPLSTGETSWAALVHAASPLVLQANGKTSHSAQNCVQLSFKSS
jgi:hypothetical protein